MAPPVVLSIAGFDPSSGAGVTADIKTAAAHGCYGVACITALTVQSTAGVRRVVAVEPELVRETLEELAGDLVIAAVKIGMLGSKGVAGAVHGFLEARVAGTRCPVVLDPVLRSSSGAALLEAAGVPELLGLLPLATVVTPNLDEAFALTGLPVRSLEEARAAAEQLHQLGARAVVVKGGHLELPTDLLSYEARGARAVREFPGVKLETRATHGTGCAFATSLACHLALGSGLEDAVRRAKDYVTGAIAAAEPLGHGAGPVDHLFGLAPRQPKPKK